MTMYVRIKTVEQAIESLEEMQEILSSAKSDTDIEEIIALIRELQKDRERVEKMEAGWVPCDAEAQP